MPFLASDAVSSRDHPTPFSRIPAQRRNAERPLGERRGVAPRRAQRLSELAQPRPEFLHVVVRVACQTDAEGQNQVVPYAFAADALIHQACREFQAQVPPLGLSTIDPITLTRKVDDP